MRNRRTLFLVCVCTMLLASSALSGEPAAVPALSPPLPPAVQAAAAALPPDARPVELKTARNGALYALLPNGCEIILAEKHNAPVVAVQAWVRTGAIHEGKALGAGLSHFCEHLLFKGTSSRPTGVLDQQIRGAGGDNNAYTDSERTVYHVTSAAEGFNVAFGALADMLMDATFPPDETVKEHAVVTKEIERAHDDPESILWEAFARTIYQEHPYRIPVLGYPDRFARVTRDEVFAYYKERYTPQATTFIAVGDLDAAAVLPAMAKSLSAWKPHGVAPAAVPPEPEQVAPRETLLQHPLCEVPKMLLGFPGVSQRNPDMYALDVLARILGDGRSSRLYQSVKDKQGLALEIGASNDTPEYPGYFVVSATVEDGKVEEARAAIWHCIEEARNKHATSEELARARRKVYAEHVFQQMTADGIAGSLGSGWLLSGDIAFADVYNERIQQVTAEEVQRAARKYLVPEKLNTVIMLPQPKEPQAAPAAAQDKQAARRAALQSELEKLQAEPGVANAKALAGQAVFEFALQPSGVRVVVCEDHSLPVVNMVIAVLGGTRWEPAELAGAGNLLAQMLDRGTAKRSLLKIAEETEGLGASLDSFSGYNAFGVSARCLKEDAARLMDLAADCMLHPSFPDDELEKLKGETLQQIAQEDESLITLNSKILRPLLYGAHPYARQKLGVPDTVTKVAAADLRTLHKAWVRPENLALSFVGDITALEALQLARQQLGELKPGRFQAPAVPPLADMAESKRGEGGKPDIAGAVLSLGFRGTTLKSPDRETLDLMTALLSGSGGRLYVSLREKQPLAYDVGVYNEAQLDGGAMVFYIQTDAQSLQKALDGMWVEVRKLRTEAVPPDELQRARNYLIGQEAIALQDEGDLCERLALAELYRQGPAEVFGRKARLEKITSDDVKAAAAKYLDEKKWAEAVLKPGKKEE